MLFFNGCNNIRYAFVTICPTVLKYQSIFFHIFKCLRYRSYQLQADDYQLGKESLIPRIDVSQLNALKVTVQLQNIVAFKDAYEVEDLIAFFHYILMAYIYSRSHLSVYIQEQFMIKFLLLLIKVSRQHNKKFYTHQFTLLLLYIHLLRGNFGIVRTYCLRYAPAHIFDFDVYIWSAFANKQYKHCYFLINWAIKQSNDIIYENPDVKARYVKYMQELKRTIIKYKLSEKKHNGNDKMVVTPSLLRKEKMSIFKINNWDHYILEYCMHILILNQTTIKNFLLNKYCNTCKNIHNKLYTCKQCKSVFYCSKTHQKRDWIKHRSICKFKAHRVCK